jgi:hypothetical protein
MMRNPINRNLLTGAPQRGKRKTTVPGYPLLGLPPTNLSLPRLNDPLGYPWLERRASLHHTITFELVVVLRKNEYMLLGMK